MNDVDQMRAKLERAYRDEEGKREWMTLVARILDRMTEPQRLAFMSTLLAFFTTQLVLDNALLNDQPDAVIWVSRRDAFGEMAAQLLFMVMPAKVVWQ